MKGITQPHHSPPDSRKGIVVDETDYYYHYYGSRRMNSKRSCLVSNDPNDDDIAGGLPILPFCNVTEYKCFPKHMNETNINPNASSFPDLVIPYDYDIYYNPQTNLVEVILPYLEEAMLEHVAAAMGTMSCSASTLSGQQRRLPAELTSEQQSYVVGVSLNPRDAIEDKAYKCIELENDVAAIVTNKSECAPVRGSLTLYLKSKTDQDNISEITTGIKKLLEKAIWDDVFVVENSIEKVVYVGKRQISDEEDSSRIRTKDNIEIMANDTSSGGKLNKMGVAILSAAGALLILLPFLVLLVCRKRKGRNTSGTIVKVCPGSEQKKKNSTWYKLDEEIVIIEVIETHPKDGSLAKEDSLALKTTQTPLTDSDDLVLTEFANTTVDTSFTDSLSLAAERELYLPRKHHLLDTRILTDDGDEQLSTPRDSVRSRSLSTSTINTSLDMENILPLVGELTSLPGRSEDYYDTFSALVEDEHQLLRKHKDNDAAAIKATTSIYPDNDDEGKSSIEQSVLPGPDNKSGNSGQLDGDCFDDVNSQVEYYISDDDAQSHSSARRVLQMT